MSNHSYWGVEFFSFFKIFFHQMFLLLTGKASLGSLTSDEIQILMLAMLGISCAIVGSFLILKRMAMVANSLSHTVLVGIVVALVVMRALLGDSYSAFHVDMKVLFIASLLSSLLTAYLTDFLYRVLRLQKDASTGLVFTTLFAVGIILVTLFTKNAHIGAEVIMGNIDMLHSDDLKMGFYLLVMNLSLLLLFFKEYLITSFDPQFGKLSRFSNRFFTYLLLFQTSATVIGAFRAVGVVLVLALLVLPVLTARLLTHRLYKMIILASAVSLLSALVGVALARHILSVYNIALSTGGVVVMTQFGFWGIALIFSPSKGALTRLLTRRRLKAKLATC
jgi:manganese/zinc/iron transport system permease protein